MAERVDHAQRRERWGKAFAGYAARHKLTAYSMARDWKIPRPCLILYLRGEAYPQAERRRYIEKMTDGKVRA